VPELSRFFGIVIRMFMEVGAPHHRPHFHALYTLTLRFTDGSQQRIDFRPVLEGDVFGPLQDLQIFNTVELDPTFGTLQWPNGADFDPETLHDWPKYREELTAMARRWAVTSDPPVSPRANAAVRRASP
jgi:hypothetical protein